MAVYHYYMLASLKKNNKNNKKESFKEKISKFFEKIKSKSKKSKKDNKDNKKTSKKATKKENPMNKKNKNKKKPVKAIIIITGIIITIIVMHNNYVRMMKHQKPQPQIHNFKKIPTKEQKQIKKEKQPQQKSITSQQTQQPQVKKTQQTQQPQVKKNNNYEKIYFEKECAKVKNQISFSIGLNNNIYVGENIFKLGDMIPFDNIKIKIKSYQYIDPQDIKLNLVLQRNNKTFVCPVIVNTLKNLKIKTGTMSVEIEDIQSGVKKIVLAGENAFLKTSLYYTKGNDAYFNTPKGILKVKGE